MFSYTIPIKAALPLRWMTQFLSGRKHDFFGQFSNPVPRSRNADYSQRSFPIIIALRTSLFHAFSLPNPLRLENDWNIFPNSIIMNHYAKTITVILKNHSSLPSNLQQYSKRSKVKNFEEKVKGLNDTEILLSLQSSEVRARESTWWLHLESASGNYVFFFSLWFLHFSMIFY